MGRLDILGWQAWPAYGPTEKVTDPNALGIIECTQQEGGTLLKGGRQAEIRGLEAAIDVLENRRKKADAEAQKLLLDISEEIERIRDACCVIPSDNAL